MHVCIRGPFDCTNGVRALLIVCLGIRVTCFIPSVHVHTDAQYMRGIHTDLLNKQYYKHTSDAVTTWVAP